MGLLYSSEIWPKRKGLVSSAIKREDQLRVCTVWIWLKGSALQFSVSKGSAVLGFFLYWRALQIEQWVAAHWTCAIAGLWGWIAEMKFEQGLMKTSGDALSQFCRLSIHWKIHFSMVKKVHRPTFESGNQTIEELQTLQSRCEQIVFSGPNTYNFWVRKFYRIQIQILSVFP